MQLVGLGRSEREEKEEQCYEDGGYMGHGKLLSRVRGCPLRGALKPHQFRLHDVLCFAN